MKYIIYKYKFLTVLFLILGMNLQAQEDDTPDWVLEIADQPTMTFEEAIESIYGSLSMEEITTGILVDKVLQWVPFGDFTGETSDTASIEFSDFEQLYDQLYQVQDGLIEMPDLEELRAIAKTYDDEGIIPVIVVDFEYDRIKIDAFENNLLVEKGSTFYDVLPRSESPYEAKRFYVAMPYKEFFEPGMQNMKISEALYFTNTERILESVEVQNGDQSVTLSLEESVEIEIVPDTISFEALYANSEIASIVKFAETDADYIAQKKSSQPKAGCGGIEYTNDVLNDLCDPAWTCDEIPGFGNKYNQFGLACYPGCNTDPNNVAKEIKKPVIIVEGFDQHDGRHFWLDDKKLKKGTWSPEQHLYFVSNDQGMCDVLRERGYDVLIFNCKDGTGDIPANALKLIEAINWVNAQKSTTEEIIIIGASMGGLIARYALSTMEADEVEHHTKLMITFDTPHRGANVALGVQTLMDDILEANLGLVSLGVRLLLKKRLDPIKSVGAQQMLLHHLVSSKSSNLKSEPSPLFNQFHSQLDQINSGGYPNQCRKVAIACGSSVGNNQAGIQYHDNLADINMEINLIFNKIKIYMKVNSTPDTDITGTKRKLSHFVYETKKRKLADEIKEVTYTTPFDNAPAGYECFHHALSLVPSLSGFFVTTNVNINPGLDAFVPTMSALDLDSGIVPFDDLNYNIKNSLGIGNTNFTYTYNDSITPFDAVYASPKNTRHVISSMDPLENPTLFEFAIGESASKVKYLQNRNIDYPVTFSAHNKIVAGRDVNPIQGTGVGDFHIHHLPPEGETNIIAGNSILLKDGFIMSPEQGLIRIDTAYFDCNEGFPCDNDYEEYLVMLKGPSNNGFFGNDAQKVFHSILETEREEILVYPNPSYDGKFLMVMPAVYDLKYSIIVTDLSGKVILEKEDSSYNFPLDLSTHPKGMYQVRIMIGEKIQLKNIVYQ